MRTAVEELSVTGSTGGERKLRIAGPGTRSYGFVIDWHIRLLAALAWLLAGLLFRLVSPQGTAIAIASRGFLLCVVVPAALVYFLYHPVLEVAMRGRTPGKIKAGARIVTLEGAIPGTGALLTRNLFRVIDSLPLLYVVGLVCSLVTARRVRLGDLAAGTVLVVDEEPDAPLARSGLLLARSGRPADALGLVRDLLERWPQLCAERRVALARAVLSKLETAAGRAALASLGEAALKERLEAWLHR